MKRLLIAAHLGGPSAVLNGVEQYALGLYQRHEHSQTESMQLGYLRGTFSSLETFDASRGKPISRGDCEPIGKHLVVDLYF